MAQKTSKYAYDRNYYENLASAVSFDGSAARKLYVVGDYSEDELEEEYESDNSAWEEPDYEQAQPEKSRPARRTKTAPNKNDDRALKNKIVVKVNKVFVGVMVIAMAALLYNALTMLHTKARITQTEKLITKAETSLADINALNESLACSLDTETDKNYIYDVAVGRLGMVYPNNNQIIYYETADSDYVRQYAAID